MTIIGVLLALTIAPLVLMLLVFSIMVILSVGALLTVIGQSIFGSIRDRMD